MPSMNAFEGLEPQRGPEDLVPGSPDFEHFARVEGLMGEEVALLASRPRTAPSTITIA
jgi:hypothetical protein